MKEEEAEGMPCLEAEPESWQTGGGGGWPWRDDLRVVRFLRGEVLPHSEGQGRAVTREKWAPTEHRPPRDFEGRCRAALVIKLEGRPPCRPTSAGRSPASIRPTMPRWRAGKMGADGASPFNDYQFRE